MTALTTEAFLRQVQQTPSGAAEVLARLRRQSVRPEGVQADPLALPGGVAGERAWHDHQMALRRQLKALLAGNKLHAVLVTAALSRPAPDRAPETPDGDATDSGATDDGAMDSGATDDGVTDYVERASHWIEAVTDALAQRWGADPRADAAAEGAALTGYHRYALARTLVAALRDLPELPERVEPERMAAYLAAPTLRWPAEPPTPDWVSAGPQTDRALAWSRALAVVLEAAVEAPFERPLETVLADARAALTEAVADRVAALDAAFSVPAEAQPIVEQHALQTAGRLYAATLRHVHRASARMIERYQALQQSGLADEADTLARDYQDRRLGYAGVPHHFQALRAIHATQQDAALAVLAAMKALAATEQPETRAPGESDQRPGAERAAGPTP